MQQSACATDKGKLRTVNEDSMLCMDDMSFYMVADGVGGHNSGEIASKLAVELTKAHLTANPPERVEESDLPDFFNRRLREVNKEIYTRAASVKENAGMATTAVMLLIRQMRAYIINIGDSRAYLFRKGMLQRVTEDHTYVSELLKQGRISKAEAEVHPKRNMITRALGSEETMIPDFFQLDLTIGDRILLCTDGLYNEVSDEEICAMIESKPNSEELVLALIRSACDNGGKDNITVCCVEI
ncbi:MAG: Stp1/IreP family PP2C-type Ser/Thr phosphatase [Anaerovoracaceae bacterium]